MPRIDNNRSLPLAYRPGPPPVDGSTPEQIIRATWDELQRISASLSDYDRPLGMSCFGPETIGVQTGAPVYDRQFNNAPTMLFERPGGTMAADGVYTIAQEGLYKVDGMLVSAPFSAPATKSYAVLVQVLKFPPTGGASATYQFSGGGLDDQQVTCVFNLMLPMLQGERLCVNAAGQHPTKAGGNSVTAYLNIVRVAGLGNNAD